MKVVTLRCANCGAPLSVKHRVRFVTCNFCDSQLEIHRENSATYSAATEKVPEARTVKLEKSVERLQLTNELERLDQAWMISQELYMVSGKDGSRSVPSYFDGLLMMFVACGVIVAAVAIGRNAPFFRPIMYGWGFGAVIFIIKAIHTLVLANRYSAAHADYEQQRYDILARLGSTRQSNSRDSGARG